MPTQLCYPNSVAYFLLFSNLVIFINFYVLINRADCQRLIYNIKAYNNKKIEKVKHPVASLSERTSNIMCHYEIKYEKVNDRSHFKLVSKSNNVD